VAWCEAVKAETIDCGVFGAFALELFRAKGIEAYPGQLLRGCAEERISHWRRKWDAIPTAFNWIGTRVVYHEVSVVRTEADRSQRLWRFDAQGRNPQIVLTKVKPIGYHA